MAVKTEVSVSHDQAVAAERNTRDQAGSRLWFHMRTGRVTASRFKSACRTDPANPSVSLIMNICHPEVFRFQTAATEWGCQHGRPLWRSTRAKAHTIASGCPNVVSSLVFSIHSLEHASPDGLVECSCCGQGICEVKVGVFVDLFIMYMF